jgi:ubiquinone biosynthesis monooxygenase Coq7
MRDGRSALRERSFGYSGSVHTTRSEPTRTDRLLTVFERALRSLTGVDHAARPYPATASSVSESAVLSAAERREAGALMRVNHVGEVCAQALYTAQALAARNDATRRQFESAARDETDHLAWTRQRLRELEARPSLLNPLWYAGAFGFGLLAARAGDAVSLGFVVETERQVEQHLESHLGRLPAADAASRAIVQQMKDDEARHGAAAARAGGVRLPAPVRWAMRGAGKVMTTTAHHL